MRLLCPECAAGYEVADHLIAAGGRSVRCSACGHVWHATAPMPEPDALDAEAEAVVSPALDALVEPLVREDAVMAQAQPAAQAEATDPPVAERAVPEAESRPSAAERHVPQPNEPPTAPRPLITEHDPDPLAPPRAGAAVWVGWVATVLVLAAAAAACVYYRAEIVEIWPPSQWIYSAIGLSKT